MPKNLAKLLNNNNIKKLSTVVNNKIMKLEKLCKSRLQILKHKIMTVYKKINQ